MTDTANPFAGLAQPTHDIIEKLLKQIWSSGEWTDEHDEMLDQWRDARGEAAKDQWAWWVGENNADEPYSFDCTSREDAIEVGRREYSCLGSFRIVEARMWNDDVKEGEDVGSFAYQRNHETIQVVLPALQPSARAVDLSGRGI